MIVTAHKTANRRPAGSLPMTIIGGFLGAGKTTMLNALLADGSVRCAVLVNDFGPLNIDARLIASHGGRTIALTNGCVCCSIGGDLAGALGDVLDCGIPFEHVIVEASGVGSPQRIAETAWVDPAFRLEGIVVVADASRIDAQLADARIGDLIAQQIGEADLVVLNKCDLVEPDRREQVRVQMRALNSRAPMIETAHAQGLALAVLASDRAPERQSAAKPADHEWRFVRFEYRRSRAFELAGLEAILDDLPDDLLRLKGFCSIAGDRPPQLLQALAGRWALSGSAQPSSSGINLAGVGLRGLHIEALTARFDAALASATSTSPLPMCEIDGLLATHKDFD